MNNLRKKLLIVDDSFIDREILKSILQDNFEIMEADNGYNALQIIAENSLCPDAILLDLSMPVLDGFSVLRLMKEKKIDTTPVILITAEATTENVKRASMYSNVSHFISKPFEANVILPRLLDMFHLDDSDIDTPHTDEITSFIENLKALYQSCLISRGLDDKNYERTADLMKILLKKYSCTNPSAVLNRNDIELISQASYFYDIGSILIPAYFMTEKTLTENDKAIFESHTSLGAQLIRLNTSPSCLDFIEICEDICLHHHERFDGKGFPSKLAGRNNSFYAQLCFLSAQFDNLFSSMGNFNDYQFDFVLKEITIDEGIFDPRAVDLFVKCKEPIILYYRH